ncbi:hypothetical protein ACJZ2D_006642 [Fusarium nematophilum]
MCTTQMLARLCKRCRAEIPTQLRADYCYDVARKTPEDAQKCIYNMTLDNKVIEEEEGPGLVCGDCSRAAQQDEKDKDKDRDKDRESEEENEEENENRAKRAKTK